MEEENLTISCETHGKNDVAVVCGHLLGHHSTPLGFVENSSIPGDLQGGCYACEYMFSQENEMTDKFKKFTNMSLVCEECYSDIKEKHSISA